MTRTITDRTIDILQILERKTDDKHPLSATDIKKLTNAIKAYEEFSSKAVYRSMNILKFWYPGFIAPVTLRTAGTCSRDIRSRRL